MQSSQSFRSFQSRRALRGTSRRARLVALSMLIALVVSACGSAGTPNSYADQQRDYTDDAGDIEQRSVTEGNYRAGCEAANEEAGVENANDYCKCTYDVFAENVPFEVFQAYDDRVKDGIENGTITNSGQLYEEFQEAYDGVEEFEGLTQFVDAMRELEDRSSETRALQELLSPCN